MSILLYLIIYNGINPMTFMRHEAFSEVMLIATAAMGILLVFLQLRHSEKLKEAEFIANFNNNMLIVKLMEVHEVCKKKLEKRILQQSGFFSDDLVTGELDYDMVYKYLDYFEPLKFMLDKKLITPAKLYSLMAFRFFAVVCDEDVVREVIVKYQPHFSCIEYMYDRLNEYRIQKKVKVHEWLQPLLDENDTFNKLAEKYRIKS